MNADTIHATALLIGPIGLLLRGASGAGKSTLADEVISRARGLGGFAALVADDRVRITVVGGRLIAQPPAPLSGLIERRGLGVMATDHEPSAVVRGIVDLIKDPPERVPMPDQRETLAGISLPQLVLQGHDPAAPRYLMIFASSLAATS